MQPQRDQQENDQNRRALLALLQGNQQDSPGGNTMQRNVSDFQARSINPAADLAMRAPASDAPYLQPYQLLALQERQRRHHQQEALKQSKQATAIESLGVRNMNMTTPDPYMDRVMKLLASRDQVAHDQNNQLQRLLLEQSAAHRSMKLQETIRLLERHGGEHNRDIGASLPNSSQLTASADTIHNQVAGFGRSSLLSQNAQNVIASSLSGSQDMRLHPSSLLLGGDLSTSLFHRYNPGGTALGETTSRFLDTGRMFPGSLLNESISHLNKRKTDEENLAISRMAKKLKTSAERPTLGPKIIPKNTFPLPPVNIPNSNKNRGDESIGETHQLNIKLSSFKNTWKRLGDKIPKMQKDLFIRKLGQSKFGKKDRNEYSHKRYKKEFR